MNHDEHQPNPPLPLDAELEARVVAWVAGELPAAEVVELQQLAAVNPAILLFKRRMEAVQGLIAEAERADTAPLRLSLERRAKLLRTLGAAESTAPLSETVVYLPRISPWSWRAPRLYFMTSGLAAAVLVGLFIWQSQQYRSTATMEFAEKRETVRSAQSVSDTAVRSDRDMNTVLQQRNRGLEKGAMVSLDPAEQKKLLAAESVKNSPVAAFELPAAPPASSAPSGSLVAQARIAPQPPTLLQQSLESRPIGAAKDFSLLNVDASDKAILTLGAFSGTTTYKSVNAPILSANSATGSITQTGAITSTNSATPNAASDITLSYGANSSGIVVLQGGAVNTGGFFSTSTAEAQRKTEPINQGSGVHSVAGTVAFDTPTKNIKFRDDATLTAVGPGNNVYLAGNAVDVQGGKFFGNLLVRTDNSANAPGGNAVSNGATTGQVSFGATGPASLNLGGIPLIGGGLNVTTNGGNVVLGAASNANAAAGDVVYTEGGSAFLRTVPVDATTKLSAGTNAVNYGGAGRLNFAPSSNTANSTDALSFGLAAPLTTGGSISTLSDGSPSLAKAASTAPSNPRPTTFSFTDGIALNETAERQKHTILTGAGGGSDRSASTSAEITSIVAPGSPFNTLTASTGGLPPSSTPPLAGTGTVTENATLNLARAEDRDVVKLSEFTVAESPVSSGAALSNSSSTRTAGQPPASDGVLTLSAFSVASARDAKAKAAPSAKVTIGSAVALGAVNLPESDARRERSAADKSKQITATALSPAAQASTQPLLPSQSNAQVTYTPNRPAPVQVAALASAVAAPVPTTAAPPSAPAPDRDPPRPVERPSTPPPPLEESATSKDPVSTFSLHVSDVSFRLAQAALARGELPDPARIRAEEFYNAFDYGDTSPTIAEKVGARIEQAAHPFLPSRNLVRVALKVPAAGRGATTSLHLTVLLDTSGSMEREDRAASVRRALEVLVSLLGPNDRITLIGFARTPRLLAENLAGNQARSLLDILARTPSEGGTNLEEAIKLGGELARRHFAAGAQNRLVLLTDGAANLGNAVPAQLGALVETLRQQGLAFDACGVGLDGLDDEVLEALTRQGDGRYYALNSPDDADAGFAQKLAGAFRPAAENVKVQVRFNPARVGHYRLIGFEQHRLREQDFRNDQVDAAELAAEEDAVALYQVELLPAGEGEIGELFVRFRDPASHQMVERSWTLPYDPAAPAFTRASPTLQLAGASALLAEKLRGGLSAEPIKLRDLVPVANSLRGHYAQDARVQQFVTMLAQARRLLGDTP